jgi:D-threo-aldose 1-dehydrogenase
MKTRPIGSTSFNVTEISFGTAPLGNLYHVVSEEDAQATLQSAWDAGIRYFDTAPHYGAGLAEERLGRFLAGKKDFVTSTKVGRIIHPTTRDKAEDHGFVDAHPAILEYDYSGDGIMRSLEASHKRTGLDHFDILFVHDIGPLTHKPEANARHMKAFFDTGIKRLDDLRSAGTIGAWGVGVNETQVCLDIMAQTHLDVILMAGRYTLLDRSAEAELLPLCKQRGTSFVIGGVFNSGILATGPVAGAPFNYTPASDDVLRRVSAMQDIAKAAGTDLATVALHFPFQNKVTASVLLGTAKPSSLARNIAALERTIDPVLYAAFEPFTLR